MSNNNFSKFFSSEASKCKKFQACWKNISKQHNWESIDGYSWEIDFETCEMFVSKS